MTWMITATGREYHFEHGPQNISLDDIAHQLALINRFHGATKRPYSVAEHSILVADIAAREGASPIVELAALLHDGHEAYTQDLASPAKHAINRDAMRHGGYAAWAAFEDTHARNVRRHYGLLSTFAAHGKIISYWDKVALATERRDLTAYNPARHKPWAVLADGTEQAIPPADWVELNEPARIISFAQQRDRFMWRAMRLQDLVRSQQIATAKEGVTR